MKKQRMTLEQFAALINSADEWKLEFDDIIVANGWIKMQDEWHVCQDGKQMIYFDDNGKAKVKSLNERDCNLFPIVEELEKAVKERKMTSRAAEIELLKKYDMEELEDVLPHRRIDVKDFDNKNLWQQNGECVSGEFPRKGKIHDNVEFCQDTQRFEFLEYFIKDEE